MMNDAFAKIPERSFGHCSWCGTERIRLQYLMCPLCFRLANIIPSKAMVLLNYPEIKQKWGGQGIAIKDFAPELYQFLLEEESHFPTELADLDHWERMQAEAAGRVTQQDIRDAADAMLADTSLSVVPTREELTLCIGMKRTLRFILLIAVARGLLKINTDTEDDGFINSILLENGDRSFEENSLAQLSEKEVDSPKIDSPKKEVYRDPMLPKKQAAEQKGMHSKEILSRLMNR